ncbi:MAG: class I SAM-dependent methyltransferase [Candidatus Altiarchaeota archaeon]
MKGDWFTRFKEGGKLYLTDESYAQAKKALEEDLPVYMRHIKDGGRILEAACGPGYTAIPLSHHFKVTAFDRDERVLEAARKNARAYGKTIEFMEADFFDIAKKFGKDSFDAVSSGGVLEHFPKDKIRKLASLQLEVAPIVFASMPLFTVEQVEEHRGLGIETFYYTEQDWLSDVFGDYNVVEHRRLPVRPVYGKFREFMVVLGRK